MQLAEPANQRVGASERGRWTAETMIDSLPTAEPTCAKYARKESLLIRRQNTATIRKRDALNNQGVSPSVLDQFIQRDRQLSDGLPVA